jgi:hypothetical protein
MSWDRSASSATAGGGRRGDRASVHRRRELLFSAGHMHGAGFSADFDVQPHVTAFLPHAPDFPHRRRCDLAVGVSGVGPETSRENGLPPPALPHLRSRDHGISQHPRQANSSKMHRLRTSRPRRVLVRNTFTARRAEHVGRRVGKTGLGGQPCACVPAALPCGVAERRTAAMHVVRRASLMACRASRNSSSTLTGAPMSRYLDAQRVECRQDVY